MAKTTGPLLSIGASGTIAKTQVYSSWKGITYARKHVVPKNPRSSGQTNTRSVFTFLHELDKRVGSRMREMLDAFAAGKPFTTHNVLIGWNLPFIKGDTDLHNFKFGNSVNGGLPPASATFTPGATLITVAAVEPTLPTGWTIDRMNAFAIRSVNPHNESFQTMHEAEDTTSPYSVDITGLTTGALYEAGALFKFSKPDGTKAWGVSLQGTATPT